MMELADLRVFSDIEYNFPDRYRGLLLVGGDEETAEVVYCTPPVSEQEAERLLDVRYQALVADSSTPDTSRAEGLMELDRLRGLCAERNRLLDELAENEAYPELVGAEDVLLGEAFGDAQLSLLTMQIEQSKQRLFAVVEA
ncbi:hypothetical protein M1L60_10970 [Actinoplanes sp. TRM 88003]|uniref:Uncharacterized protein n=1 Tax=Paractinoplanes aksuensis TaxID=2939490 RepID=A0ABT1DJU8_9ACTN|nr:hypothetical protein [Actinoplanes aksuensis]MCO8271114.1 hypothetical protein [Actinoplanes aksuensis]